MNTNLSAKQVEIILNLLIDNGLLYEEAQETFLIFNDTFKKRLDAIIECYHRFYIECEENKISSYELMDYLLNIIDALDEFRNDYKNRETIFQDGAYKTMNSLYDRTHEAFIEAFEEFINIL